MKLRLLFALLLLPLLAAAKVPDEEDILRQTMDAASPYYYPNLLLRYHAGDQTLNEEEYHYLYYGYAYHESYKPLSSDENLNRALMIASTLDLEDPSRESLEQLIMAANDALRQDPFNPGMLNLLAFAYGALGDERNEQINYNRMNSVLLTIEESGDGLTEKSPWHILMFSHATDLLAAHERDFTKGRVISRSVEFIPLVEPLRTPERKIKGYYFDYSRIYRNKPDDYVFERPRTWQFNNLKPQEYK